MNFFSRGARKNFFSQEINNDGKHILIKVSMRWKISHHMSKLIFKLLTQINYFFYNFFMLLLNRALSGRIFKLREHRTKKKEKISESVFESLNLSFKIRIDTKYSSKLHYLLLASWPNIVISFEIMHTKLHYAISSCN